MATTFSVRPRLHFRVSLPLVFFLCVLMTLASTLSFAQSNASEAIGKVTKVDGLIFVRRGTSFKVAKPGLPIKVGAEISTAVFAKLEFELNDGTRVGMSERSIFVLDAYQAGTDSPAAEFTLTSGALLVSEGEAGDAKPLNLKIKTPVAEVQANGGSYWAGHKFFPGDGLHVVQLKAGNVAVRSQAGEVLLASSGQGTNLDAISQKPVKPHAWTPEKLAAAHDAVEIP